MFLEKELKNFSVKWCGSVVKNLPAKFQSLGGEDPLEEEMATPSSTLAWEIPWTQEPDR